MSKAWAHLGQIEDRLHNLETQMADQFNVIKTMLLNIEDKLTQQDSQYRRANRKLHGAVVELTESVQGCTNSNQHFPVNTGSSNITINTNHFDCVLFACFDRYNIEYQTPTIAIQTQ